MDDAEILDSLLTSRGLRNADKGAGGNCLFLSIAPQVAPEDVSALPLRSAAWVQALGEDLGERWGALPARERARLLRRIAILDEQEFIAKLASLVNSSEPMPAEISWRALELFKDMAEEFISKGKTELAEGLPLWGVRETVYNRVREKARDTPAGKVHAFVLEHAEEYMRCTGREGNWAGSSEMAALASALGRSFEAYGNNWVSQDAVELRPAARPGGTWEVQPYFAAKGGRSAKTEPVRIFQTNGGGHYQALEPVRPP